MLTQIKTISLGDFWNACNQYEIMIDCELAIAKVDSKGIPFLLLYGSYDHYPLYPERVTVEKNIVYVYDSKGTRQRYIVNFYTEMNPFNDPDKPNHEAEEIF